MTKTNGATDGVAEPTEAPIIRTSKFRFVILFLFVLYSASNAFPWVHYSILATIVTDYYGVSFNAINWTGIVYFITNIPLIFPALWLLSRAGLRVTILFGAFGTALGAWIKCASVAPDRFVVTMVGQIIVAASQVFVLNIPPRLAAVWFGPNEVSTACAIGVLGNQVGVAFGFLIPREIVKQSGTSNSTNIAEISEGLNYLFYGTAIFSSLLFFAFILLFKAAPPNPPSLAAASAAGVEGNFFQSIVRLIRNKNYCLLVLSYGINVGVYYTISIVLDQVYEVYFPNDSNSGRIGLTFVVAGMVGSVIAGYWLDRTHKFKETTLALYIFTFIGMVAFTFMFKLYQIWLVFVSAFFLGCLRKSYLLHYEKKEPMEVKDKLRFCLTGYLPVGFEFAAEITYPESEGISAGLLNAAANVFGILCTEFASYLLTFSDIIANLFLCAVLLVGVVMTVLIKADLKRQAAQGGELHATSNKEGQECGNVNHMFAP